MGKDARNVLRRASCEGCESKKKTGAYMKQNRKEQSKKASTMLLNDLNRDDRYKTKTKFEKSTSMRSRLE